MVDQVANFKKVTVSTGYNNTATSIVLAAGQGAELPNPSGDNYNVVWYDSTNYPDPADDPNVEVVRVTAKSTDTLTVTRNQESSGASNKNNADATYKIILATTSKTITDLIADVEKAATVIVGKSGHVDYLTTDYGSDGACIKAALDAVETAGGGCVVLREGSYTITADIDWDMQTVKLVGQGMDSTVLYSTNGNCIVIDTADSIISIENLKIYTISSDANEGVGIYVNGDITIDINLHKVRFNTVVNAIQYKNNPSTGASLGNISITECEFTRSSRNSNGADYIDGYHKVNIAGHKTIDKFLNISYNKFAKATDQRADVVELSLVGDSSSGTGKTATAIIGGTISHNRFDDSTRECMLISDFKELNIIGNIQNESNRIGFYYMRGYRSVIADNQVHTSAHRGHRIDNIEECIWINNAAYDTGASDAFGTAVGGMTVYCSKNNIIKGNIIDAAKDSAILIDGEVGAYSTGNIITHNNLLGSYQAITNTDAANNTGNIIENNLGFNPVGSVGPPSVPATTVNYTNAYGYPCQVQVYGGTVTEIDIDDIATGLTSGIFMIPPSGTINITYSAAPSWRWWGL